MNFRKHAYYFLLIFLISCETLKSREYEALSDEAWKNNDSNLALRYIDDAISSNQKEGRLYFKKTLYLKAENRYKEALTNINLAISNSETSDLNYSLKATIFFYLDALDSSFFYHDLAIKSAKNPEKALTSRAETNFKLKQYEKALNDVNKSLELNNNNLSAYFLRGEIFLNGLQKPENAIEDFSHIIKLDNRQKEEYGELNALALTMRGIGYYKLEQTNLACLDWKNALDEGYMGSKGLLEDFCR